MVAFQFTGHERDAANLGDGTADLPDYMHARYYSAGAGRFLSMDPAMDLDKAPRDPPLWDRYTYARNNPIRNTDPDGELCIPCAAVGAFAAVGYESYRQVKSGESVNNARLLAAVGIGAAAGALVGAAAPSAPVVYNTTLANPAAVATATTAVGLTAGHTLTVAEGPRRLHSFVVLAGRRVAASDGPVRVSRRYFIAIVIAELMSSEFEPWVRSMD